MHLMKLVRLRANLTEPLLRDSRLNLRVILLVRDPRGTMNSRKNLKFCNLRPDCYSAKKLCQDLESDYFSGLTFEQAYPKKFRCRRLQFMTTRGSAQNGEWATLFDVRIVCFLGPFGTRICARIPTAPFKICSAFSTWPCTRMLGINFWIVQTPREAITGAKVEIIVEIRKCDIFGATNSLIWLQASTGRSATIVSKFPITGRRIFPLKPSGVFKVRVRRQWKTGATKNARIRTNWRTAMFWRDPIEPIILCLPRASTLSWM